MKFKCPHCQQNLKIPDQAAGRRVKCPACQQPFVVTVSVSESEQASIGSLAGNEPNLPDRLSIDVVPVSAKDPAVTDSSTGDISTPNISRSIDVNTSPGGPTSRLKPWLVKLQAVFDCVVTQAGPGATKMRDDVVAEVAFYRANQFAFWKQVLSGPIKLWWGYDGLPSAREMLSTEGEKANGDWQVQLAPRCVKCGAKATEREQVARQPLFDFFACQLVWVVVAATLLSIVWRPAIGPLRVNWLLTLILAAAAIIVIFRFRREHTAVIRFRRCANHKNSNETPRVFLVNGGLIVRFGNERARRWLAGSRTDIDDEPAVPTGDEDDLPISIPIPEEDDNLGAAQDSSPSPPRSIPMVDDVEPTPILHAENTLSLNETAYSSASPDLLFRSIESATTVPSGLSAKLPTAERLTGFVDLSTGVGHSTTINPAPVPRDDILDGIPVEDHEDIASSQSVNEPGMSTPSISPFFRPDQEPVAVSASPRPSDSVTPQRERPFVVRMLRRLAGLFVVLVVAAAVVASIYFPDETQQFLSRARTEINLLLRQWNLDLSL